MPGTEKGCSCEYAKAGVDYIKIEPFKQAMIEVGRRTLVFPQARDVFVREDVLHAHGGVFEYRGGHHLWCKTTEGLGNKNWIAEWMYQNAGTGRTYYEGIGIDTALMAVNDVIAQGAMPVIYTDEVAAGDSGWFSDVKRATDLANSFYRACEIAGMALVQGESPALPSLVNAALPVKSAPSLSGCVTGVIAPPSRLITGAKLGPGDRIVGVASSGLHANGASLVIEKALALPEQFLTRLPTGRTLGEEALIITRSYVDLIEALLLADIDIHALVPGTGSGISKIAFDKRNFTYRISAWLPVPPIFQCMRELGVTIADCLRTFNWGVGYYIFVSPKDVERIIRLGKVTGYELAEIGAVEQGPRQVIFEPEHMVLPPPGE